MFSQWHFKYMRLILCSVAFICIFSVDLIGQTAGDYRTVASGDWNNSSIWEFYNGTAWVALGTVSTDNNNLNTDPGWSNVNITGSISWLWGATSGNNGLSGGLSFTNPVSSTNSTWYYKAVNLTVGVTYSLTFDYKTTNTTSTNSRIVFAISPNTPTGSTTWTGATELYNNLQATSNVWVPNTGTATFTPSSSGTYYFGFRSGYNVVASAITTSIDNIILTGVTNVPSSLSGNINIRNGHLVDINNDITIDQTTIDAGGSLELKAGTITLNDGSGTDLQINGTYRRSAITSISMDPLATITVGSGGIYEHNFSGGAIPDATWADGSLLLLSKGSNAGGLDQSFYDVKVTGGTTTLSPDATSRTMTVRNDMRIEGGVFEMKDGTNGGVHVLIIYGNFLHSGGTYTFNVNVESDSEIRLELKKDWIISGTATWGGFIASSGLTQCNSGVYFSGTGDQTFSTILPHNSGDLRNRFYVASSVTGLHEKYMGTASQFTINGSGGVCPATTIAGFSPWPTSGNLLKTFTINNPGGVILRDNRNIKDTLYRTIGSITADPADPTVEVISYSTGATLEYNGTSAITTESMEFPASNGPTNLNINNPGSVTLHASRSLAGKLIFSIDNGLLNTTACKNNETTTGTAIITLNDDATVVGAGDKRFVNGVITKIGNDAFEFPIGEKQGSVLKYGPARITAPTNITDQYTACYVGSSPGSALPSPGYDPASKDASLTTPTDYKVSTCEYWHVNSSSASTNVLLSLSWAYGRSCKFSTASDLVITNWLAASTKWTNRLNNCGGSVIVCPDPNASTQRSGWVQSPIALSQTSPNIRTFTLAHPSLATITLNEAGITLRAIRRNHADQLDWTLTRACINAFVTVELSTDGFTFYDILQFPVRDLESCQTNMQYAHKASQAPSSFYRLKAVLPGGTFLYSNTVRLDGRISIVQIFPNPAAGQIRLTGIEEKVKELTVCNQLGQIIYSDKNIQTTPYLISAVQWETGIYYLRLIYHNGESEYHKIIRQ